MFDNLKKSFSKSNSENSSDHEKKEHGLLPVKLYLAIFTVLLLMIFVNVGIAHLPIPSLWKTILLMTVALIQTILVAVFFMELIHEDKFYSFVFGSAVLFMLLFFTITLAELSGRDFFHKNEGIKILRGVDQKGNFAPGGPKLEHSTEQNNEHEKK
ncbi:cytochrome C oxidase subunit IV family protein [Silvanigrella sp.]|jgi:caa(3)-type oxidase subunit IV|uniref:cytochrome C oxidase subunit IV family protein n=1 Tax=Silvanigrella sp. TaxID=2024976 RepID=UPI0037C7B2ED